MRRIVFALLGGASLLLTLAAGAAWAASYARPLPWHEVARHHKAGWDVALFEPTDDTFDTFGMLDHGNPQGIERGGSWRITWISSTSGRLGITRRVVEYPTGSRDLPPVEVMNVRHTSYEMFGPVGNLGAQPPGRLERWGFHYVDERGIAWVRGRDGTGPVPLVIGVQIFTLPYWPLVLAGLPLPALWLWRNRRSVRRARRGRCPRCGYDLRESLARCPECGTDRQPRS